MAEQSATAPVAGATEATGANEAQNGSSQDVLDATEAAGQSGQPQKAAALPKKEELKRIKKLKLKVDGREIEEEVNFDDDEYLTRQLQFAKAAQNRMQEYSNLQREVVQFVNMLKQDPRRALSDPSIGVDVKDLARQIIEEEIANSQKSPEQLEKESLQRELQALKEEREREKEDFRNTELTRLKEQEYERYDMLMTQAIEKTDLPKSPYIIKKMADYMLLGLENNIDLTPDEVLPLVRDEIYNDIKEMFGAMPEEVIENMIGKDVFNRVRKKNLAKAKGQTAAPPVPLKAAIKDTGKTSANQEKKPAGKKMTYREFFKM